MIPDHRLQKPSFAYVDLFAGCGGLSLGLESAGGNLVLAVEKSPMAAETFARNLVNPNFTEELWRDFLQSPISHQLEEGLVIGDVVDVLQDAKVRESLLRRNVDLVAGGPPCQGFSLAGKRQQDDVRNKLPEEFLKYVKTLKPKMVIVENVLGMNLKFKSQEENADSAFNQVALALEKTGDGYLVQRLHLNSSHYGAAQNRERLFLVAISKKLAKETGVKVSSHVWKSTYKDEIVGEIPDLAPIPKCTKRERVTVAMALADLIGKSGNNSYLRTLKDNEFWKLSQHRGINNHNKRSHGDFASEKFEIYIALANLSLSHTILRGGLTESQLRKRADEISKARENMQFPLFKTDGTLLSRNFQEFEKLVEKYKTLKRSQRVINLKSVAPTVITSPDDYIHPLEPRVLTVREMARLQGFSDHFVFYAKETTGGLKRRTEVPQYSQVGNAVSPFVSRALGELVQSVLSRQN
jgi:DNA (cytosine-5)-methyltransferase 1